MHLLSSKVILKTVKFTWKEIKMRRMYTKRYFPNQIIFHLLVQSHFSFKILGMCAVFSISSPSEAAWDMQSYRLDETLTAQSGSPPIAYSAECPGIHFGMESVHFLHPQTKAVRQLKQAMYGGLLSRTSFKKGQP